MAFIVFNETQNEDSQFTILKGTSLLIIANYLGYN